MLGDVLMIAYYFPPMGLSGVQRTLKFVKYLPTYQWKPIILTTADPTYYAFDESLITDIDPEETLIYRTDNDPTQKYRISKKEANNKSNKTIEYPSRFTEVIRKRILQTVFQPDSRRPWMKYAIEMGRKAILENNVKVIYATAPPFTDFLVGQQLAHDFGLPLIVDYRDLWVDNAYYHYTTTFHKRAAIKMEQSVLNVARKAIVTGNQMKERMLDRYKLLDYNDIVVIPHGYDSEDFEGGLHTVKPDPNTFTITHSGLFPDDLTPKYFLKAFRKFLDAYPQAEKVCELRFAGLMRKQHIKLIKKYKLDNITNCKGYIPHADAINNLLESDVLWFMIPNNIATPSRLYEYIGSLRPMIISAPPGDIIDAAEATGIAITTKHNDVNAIADAIEKYYRKWQRKQLPKANPSYANKFDRKYLTRDLAYELNKVLSLEQY